MRMIGVISSATSVFGVLAGVTGASAQNTPKTPATVTPDVNWTGPIVESDGVRFVCPDNKVVVGRRHDGDENGNTYYRCAEVSVAGALVPLNEPIWSVTWENAEDNCNELSSRECNHSYLCPNNRVMVGRYHESDEAGQTEYACARATTAAGVFPEGSWHVIKSEDDGGQGESNHIFDCPEGTVMTGRYHKGDENGETGYACGYLFPGPEDSSGSVTVRQAETEQPCTLSVPNDLAGTVWTYFLSVVKSQDHDIAACSGNTAEDIEMTNVPSAATILLTDDEFCRRTGDFWIELKTTQKSVSFPYLHLPEILKTPKGQIISGAKGLRLIDSNQRPGTEVTRALSCVQITNSAAPPQ